CAASPVVRITSTIVVQVKLRQVRLLEFVEQNYVTLKRSNPEFPILIRECSGVQARLWARYDFGKETSVSVENMSADQVAKALQTLAQSKP
uniref:NADH dehydrogenase [ubiquinone] 1 alpha subcomplex subunit 2 n=1 Tax=Neolamprologus brichardi TaxID=32507 RepID=A0A3Q4NBP1_NEOBR